MIKKNSGDETRSSQAQAQVADANGKRPYHTPQPLIHWGSIADLTRGSGSGNSDQDETGSSFLTPE